MGFSIKTDKAKWRAAVNLAADKAAEALAEQMMQDSLQIIPKQEGSLRDSGRIEKTEGGGRALVWKTVYAPYQWFGERIDGSHKVRNYSTPGTGKMWVEQARTQNAENWRTVAQNAINKSMKE